jgi:hypothetical protein
MKVYRLLIYEGSEKWIDTTFSHNAVKGIAEFGLGNFITSHIITENEANKILDVDVEVKGEL